jgi:hypothetical protein
MNSIPCPIPDSQKKSQKNPSRLSPGRFHINVNKQNPITELEFMPKNQQLPAPPKTPNRK